MRDSDHRFQARLLVSALALVLALAGCSTVQRRSDPAPQLVPASALDELLLSADAINGIMATSGMTPHPPVTVMGDHRNLLPNLNCLAVWQVNEAAVYGDGWTGLRQQLLRSPDSDDWRDLVVQSVVSYPSTQAARDFYNQSSDRWSKCTDHHVNITLNGQPLPRWTSGALSKTDTELSMPFTRVNAGDVRSCQRALGVVDNVVIDVQACTPPADRVNEGTAIVHAIEAALSNSK